MLNVKDFYIPTVILTTLLAALSSAMGFFSFSKATDPSLKKSRNLLLTAASMSSVAVILLSFAITVWIAGAEGKLVLRTAIIGVVLAVLLLLGSTIIYGIAAAELRNYKTPLIGAIVGSISSFIGLVTVVTITALYILPEGDSGSS